MVYCLCSALTTATPTDKKLLQLEEELQSLSSNTTNVDSFPDSEDNIVSIDRVNRVIRPTSGRRYSKSRNATITYTGSNGRSRTRTRFRQRPAATRKPQKGGRQRGRNRGRKFRGKGKNRMRTKQKGTGSGRRLKSTNSTMTLSDQEQSDAAYNAPLTSDVGGSSSAEGREEMTNTLEPSGGRQPQRQRPGVPYLVARSCEEMRCQRGGYCVVVDDRQGRPTAHCQCPLGTKGRHCETGPYMSCYCQSHFVLTLIICHNEGTHRVRTHAVLLYTLTLTLTFELLTPKPCVTSRISQDHSLYKV